MISQSPRAILKWYGNFLAILCHSCGKKIKTQKDFSAEEEDYAKGIGPLGPQHCYGCVSKARINHETK